MNYFDYHLHSEGSFDCEVPLLLQAEAANRAGISEICVTDHVDLDPFTKENYPASDFTVLKKKHEEILPLSPIPIRFGVELGVYKENIAEYEAFLKNREFDFVICSQHYVIDCDPYFSDRYYSGLTQKEAYDKYLLELYRSISAFQDYNVVGHIGYVTKYYPGPEEKKLQYQNHADLIDAILKKVIESGKGIEINTGGIDATGETLPTKEIAARYLELGGEIITTGSDSHKTENTGKYIADAVEMLKSIGFRYVCSFSERKPIFHRIG